MAGTTSQPFNIQQGVRQGGILSTDLYKLYVNPLLNQYTDCGLGARIGTILNNNCACADDVCIMCTSPDNTQLLVNMAHTFATEERYLLQPKKTVSITVRPTKSTKVKTNVFQLGGSTLADVESAMHLGINRKGSIKETAEDNVERNISKARRALYSLLGAGLHGQNGLDPATSLNLYRVYILPILTYGLEIILPRVKLIEKLESFHKKTLKQLLSLPSNAADPCVYILTGLLPVQAIVDLKILTFFNNICNQGEDSLERQIFSRQFNVKRWKSNSWAKHIQPLLTKYDLGDVETYLDNALSKQRWKRNIQTVVVGSWKAKIERQAALYSSLKYMNCTFTQGKLHPILQAQCDSTRETTRLPARLRVLSGTYNLQVNRARFNQNAVSPLCPLCGAENETLDHFLLRCISLQIVRDPIIDNIFDTLRENNVKCVSNAEELVNLIVDFSAILPSYLHNDTCGREIEFQARRLIYNLHAMRYRVYKRMK